MTSENYIYSKAYTEGSDPFGLLEFSQAICDSNDYLAVSGEQGEEICE